MNPNPLARLAPPLFVLIWATGFIVARFVAPYAEPLTFLLVRYALAILVLVAIVAAARVSWPRRWSDWRNSLIAGVLLHGFYLGGVFWSVKHGLPAGISALVAGLQPLTTALLAGPILGEQVSLRRWAGIALGFLGAALVVAPKLGTGGVPPLALGICILGMLSITLGTIWQKRTGSTLDLRVNAAIQYMGAAAATLPLVLLFEEGRMELTAPLLGALAWAVFGLSIGAIGLLLFLIRQGAVVGVATLLYLVPPVAALMAFGLFGETLSLVQLAGMALAALGVAVASRS
ncbi:drug/metabolite transporter (DMT)-like permease [Microvirga flocculans]|uniref:Drug/metabolite transporter (DMT)-like permease n=1 Tax=Microvirga flocculans TaxID=217168 RepID=A0A7W6N8E4_9HYPH|nr:DMT family transporter [Microvirga flocculans]MBB4040622.1 drug/metabolite transporter (DMT)-like permease [Microvirga flocculans]